MNASAGPLATHVSGSGAGVLWLHGYTMDSSLWRPLWERLPGWRHIGVDLPSHGGSQPWDPRASLADTAALIADVARSHEAHRVVALSFGSSLALQLAFDEPDLVHRLVLGAPTIAGAATEAGTARRYNQLAALYRLAGAGEHLTRLWMTSPPDIFRGTEAHPELRAAIRSVVDAHRWTELGNGALRTMSQTVHTDADLSRIRAATLVAVGDQEMPGFVANAERLSAVLPDCRVAGMAAAGHLCLLERPDEAAELIDTHLRSGA
ncbi:alpha/beta fold hydrolase [Streptacidiphilus sp. EB129]|uniref:alpha/beta fold hydrolase n=1 Tax=Streptacidiphilus sp. EB129 TaxID=3156262 RepID=UPI0035167ED4